MTLSVRLEHAFDEFRLDVSFEVDSPGVTALFGPSGAGKSTTVDAIAGLLRPERGRIAIAGETVFDSGSGVFVPGRKRRVGYVFQDARLFPHMSVRANLEFGARRTPEGLVEGELAALAELLGIGHLLERRPASLSGGERQRVALGRAVLARPRLLLLDEPLAALDPARKQDILPYLERLRDEARMPMVYVSHSLDEVARLADRVILLHEGQVAAEGSVFDLMARLDLLPLLGRYEAGAVLPGRVTSHDSRHDLTEVAAGASRLWVPRLALGVGEAVRLRVRALDVMISLRPPEAISANNVLRGTVSGLKAETGAYVDVQITCGDAKLLSQITHKSHERLGLELGQEVFAVIKSATVDRR